MDNTELMNAFNNLNTESKKQELMNLVLKTEKLIEVALKLEGIDSRVDIKREQKDSQDETLSQLYENLWNLKNQLLLLYSVSTNNKSQQ